MASYYLSPDITSRQPNLRRPIREAARLRCTAQDMPARATALIDREATEGQIAVWSVGPAGYGAQELLGYAIKVPGESAWWEAAA